MIILKYLTKFRLILYVGSILCVVIVTTSPFALDFWSKRSRTAAVREENITTPKVSLKDAYEEIRVSEIYPNCGIRYMCSDDTFPVHIYTGQDKDDQPKLCVQGRYLAGGGRGLNIAVIEPHYLQIVLFQNFDLYSHNSTALETMLTGINLHDIVIAFTSDEASKELSSRAKRLLYLLGSGKIQDLQYRSQWYMISQMTVQFGFTPLESLTYARNDRWGEVIDERLCVPRTIKHLMISPDPVPRKNPIRERLCSTNKELACEEFCSALARHEPIFPSLLTNRTLIGNLVFSTPILVIAGTSLPSLALTLESLVYQPGIHSAAVFILHAAHQTDASTLGRIFGFRSIIFNVSQAEGPNAKLNYGLKSIHDMLPAKKYAIVIEEGLLLSPDFLFYLAQMAPVMEQDETVLAVSSWNPYGYLNVSGQWNIAYRVEDYPGLGSLLKMDFFMSKMYNKMDTVCPGKSFFGCPGVLRHYEGGNIIIPDVSRVLKLPRDYLKKPKNEEFNFITTPRKTNTNIHAYIHRPEDFTNNRYFQQLAGLVESSITIHLTNEDLRLCEENANIAMKVMLAELKNKVFAIYYREESCTNHLRLRAYAKCFSIYIPPSYPPQTLYKKVLRFSVDTNLVLLIEASSPFAKNKLKF